ncbi:hypothetical protein BD414DRAFT_482320 [Trametes punicea]|nr:hypothetical protein BD414DRAFT_482320 [Trametes punicea]
MNLRDLFPPSLRTLWPTLSILPLLFLSVISHAGAMNVTVDDTSSLIVYSPASAWHASSIPCATCLAPNPEDAFQGTWHDGTHIIPTADADDEKQPSQTSGAGDTDDDDGSGEDDDDDGRKQGRRDASDALRKRDQSSDPADNPFFTPNFDSDDAGFVDETVLAEFNFTGSAIYVYALVPLAAAHANTTPTSMNLTFVLDSHPTGTYQHNGTASTSAFLPSQLVFSKGGLPEEPHSVAILVEPDSVLLLDYIVYTQASLGGVGTGPNETISSALSAPGAQGTGSGTGSPAPSGGPETVSLSQSKSHNSNIATFAGAVGGSVGLLAVLALSLAISIYRRRARAARRDRQRRAHNRSSPDFDGESFHTDASEDSPPMQGPTPFVPRYFPGTVVPAPPPPYTPPSEQTAALLASASPVSSPLWAPPRLLAPGEDVLYADQPPPTPPPLPEDGLDDYFAPPSFQIAISSPIPAILAGYSPVPTSSPPASPTPVPRLSNGPESRGVYATVPPHSRSRANSDAQSQRSDWSDRPPSFASQAPPLVPTPQQGDEGGSDGMPVAPGQEQRTSNGDRLSVRSDRSR